MKYLLIAAGYAREWLSLHDKYDLEFVLLGRLTLRTGSYTDACRSMCRRVPRIWLSNSPIVEWGSRRNQPCCVILRCTRTSLMHDNPLSFDLPYLVEVTLGCRRKVCVLLWVPPGNSFWVSSPVGIDACCFLDFCTLGPGKSEDVEQAWNK